MLQSHDIIANFLQVIGAAIHGYTGRRRPQTAQRRLRALELAGQHGLALQKRTHQNVRIGQAPAFVGQFAD